MTSKCALCNSESNSLKYAMSRLGFPILIRQCDVCGLIFQHYSESINPDKLYTAGYYSGDSKYSYIDERNDKFIRDIENKRRIANLKTFFPKDRDLSLLDVGCSFGALVETAIQNGMDAHGIDISEHATSYSSKLINKDVCDGIDGKYSIITMIEVIEHLRDINSALSNCYNALEDDGVLLIQTTNMDSVVRRFEGDKSRYFLPGHLFYFSIKTLTAMLKKHNFKIEKIYFGHETGFLPAIMRKSIANLDRYNAPDWLIVLYTIFVHLLSKLHIGKLAVHNGVVIVARKIG